MDLTRSGKGAQSCVQKAIKKAAYSTQPTKAFEYEARTHTRISYFIVSRHYPKSKGNLSERRLNAICQEKCETFYKFFIEGGRPLSPQREESLAKQLSEMRSRKRKLVDPLQFEMSIQAEDLTGYSPAFGYEMGPPSDKQRAALEKFAIFPDEIENAGNAKLLLERLAKRRAEGLTTPKQIRLLEGKGFQHVGQWQFNTAKYLIDRIAANKWQVPESINPAEYVGV